MRADIALVDAGLARSRTHARRIIEEGRARLAGEPILKPSAQVADISELSAVDVPDGVEYASRAAHKLSGALDLLGVDPADLACLDAGASTGGFTDVLLRRGAASVVAVDIGHDQLAPHLAGDPRVIVRDGTSVRGLELSAVGAPVDLTVADLSFISLRTVLADLARVSRPGGTLLLMVKPQFEVGRGRLGRGGVVRDPALQAAAVRGVVDEGAGIGLRLRGAGASPLPGQEGNREFFVLLERAEPRADAHGAGAEGFDGPAASWTTEDGACEMIDRIVRGDDPGGRLPA